MSIEETEQYRAYITLVMGLSAIRDEDGPLPAKKATIDSIPVVKITEEGTECSICLTEYEVTSEAKEMPCKHKFHSDCLNKWLSIHGSCPVCRFELPIEEENSYEYDGMDFDEENLMTGFSAIIQDVFEEGNSGFSWAIRQLVDH